MTARRALAAFLLALVSLPAAAAGGTETAFQVVDLVHDDPVSTLPLPQPGSVLVIGDEFLFAGMRVETGEELWRSDGTAAGTMLVMDVNPGQSGSGLTGLTRAGGMVFFFADDGTHGYELWRTDGTSAGTTIVRDICPGTCDGARVRNAVAHRDRFVGLLGAAVYFPGDDGVHGPELWRSDGTPEGTSMVADAVPGEAGTGATQITVAGGVLYYVGGVGLLTRLWRSDGSAAGTWMVSDVGPREGYYGAGPTSLTALGARLLFVVDDATHGVELWGSDGTSAGTGMLADLCPGSCSGLAAAERPRSVWQGKVYFRGHTPGLGMELWESDGTLAGTLLVADLNPGPGDGLSAIAPARDALYLVANNGVNGAELWVGDGSPGGTRMIHDFWPGKVGLGGANFVAAGGLLYFTAYGGLWRSDGTLRGTGVIFASFPRTPYPTTVETPITELDGRLLFYATDEAGTGLFTTDGTWLGTAPAVVVPVPDGSLPGSWPRDLRATLGGLTFFTERAAPLYYTQARAGTTVPVMTGPYSIRRGDLATAGESIYYFGVDGLWRTSLTNPQPAVIHSRPLTADRMSSLTEAGGRVFFIGEPYEGGGKEIAVVDPGGGSASTTRDICEGECWATAPAWLQPFGDRLAFTANTHGIYDGGVWLSDGTEAGTVEIAKLGREWYSPYDEYALAAAGPLLYFAGTTPEAGQELWVSDGIPGHAALLSDVCPGSCYGLSAASAHDDLGNRRIVAAGPGRVYFLADDGVHGRELWISDGTPASTVMVADLTPGALGSTITWMTAAGSGLFFSFDDGEHGCELWFSDGTAGGTRLVEDVNPGVASGVPSHLAWADGVLLFAASDGIHGLEPWRSDGTWWGTRQIADIVPGPGSSSPSELTLVDAHVFFRAYELETGFELWAVAIDGSTRLRRRLSRD